jgi:S-adenosylmethionine-diacylglycerol 3-amino-3-carboxypropyl transferase
MINADGLRHNALYTLFVPGFIAAAVTDNLLLALLIGFPGVIDWAVVHTRIGTKPDLRKPNSVNALPTKIEKAAVFKSVVYAQCWEDPDIDRRAFRMRSGDTVFSITSGGCNTLAFLIDDPCKVIALDLNPCQNYLLELKMAAIRSLDHNGLLKFIGVLRSEDRKATYQELKVQLTPEATAYWDGHYSDISRGIIHSGRYERYMHLLGKSLRFMIGTAAVDKMFERSSKAEREEIYNTQWNNKRWTLFTKLLLSRQLMTLLFDRAFFAQLDKRFSFGDHFRKVVRRGVINFNACDNPYLSYMLSGAYCKGNLPVYLMPEYFDVIKSRLDRISIVNKSCEDYFSKLPDSSISRFNFSNIFEWIPFDAYETLLRATIRVAKDQAVLTYRNLLVDRSRPDTLARWIYPRKDLAARLHDQDRAFIYKSYIVEEIKK